MAGSVSLSGTLANVVARVDLEQAHRLAPWDGKITGALAQQSMSMAPDSASDSRAARLAREALRQDATAVEALTVLGLQAQLRGTTETSRQLFAHSLTLSRRELQPQIWAIEEAVSRGDIAGALHHYDVALRTSRRGSDILYPVLASAIGEPLVRSRLIALLETKPVWSEGFIDYVANRAQAPEAAAIFFREAEGKGLPIEDADRTAVVNALAARSSAEEAWRYYVSFRNGAVRERSRAGNFSVAIERPSLFDWTTRSATGASASLHPAAGGGSVDFEAAPSAGGVVLVQMQILPAGRYRLTGRVADFQSPERSRPYLSVSCRDGRELARIALPDAPVHEKPFEGLFVVPSVCPVQRLALVIRPSDDVTGVAGRVTNIEVAPAVGD